MKKTIQFDFIFLLIVALYSCSKPKGIWDDNIHLSARTAELSAAGDSITLKTEGSWWWVSDISVDSTWYYGFTDIYLQADSYIIKQDCFDVEHRDKQTLFIKVASNPDTVKRIITVGLEAGDFHDRVTITQKAK
jgi:hypothetical protein